MQPDTTLAGIDDSMRPYPWLMRRPDIRWWRPVAGAFVVLIGWGVAGAVLVSAQRALTGDRPGTVSWSDLLASNLTLVSLIPLSLLVTWKLNRQRPGLLSSVTGRLRLRPLAFFGLAAIFLEGVALLVIKIGGLQTVGSPGGVAKDAAAIIAVTLTTSALQAAAEEYFFRGYLLQAVGSMVRSPLVAILVTTIVFTIAHGVWPWNSPALFADRFAFGLVAAYLAVRTGGLEASIAAHAANNVVTFVYAALTSTVAASLQASDAPWPLVVVDVAKFVAFAAVAVVIARRHALPATSKAIY